MSQVEPLIDLVPEEFRWRRRFRGRLVAWLAIMVTVIGVLMLLGISTSMRVRALDEELRPLRAGVQAMSPWAEKLSPLADRLKAARDRQLVVNRLIDEPYWSALLSDMASAANARVWFTQLRLWKENRQEEDVEIEVVRFMVSGTASSNLDVIEFMTNVAVSPHIEDLQLESSKARQEKDDAQPLVEFDVRGNVKWR